MSSSLYILYRSNGCGILLDHFFLEICIGNENLSSNVATEQWDQVKIVCTQPYNQVSEKLAKVIVFMLYFIILYQGH